MAASRRCGMAGLATMAAAMLAVLDAGVDNGEDENNKDEQKNGVFCNSAAEER